jgi:exodeoxyribonuclease VII large subunit
LTKPGKKPLPKTIRKIGIVTSSSGAAYHDIMETLSKKMPVSTVLFDALVQGEDAPKSLMRALDRAYKSDCDIIIFGRGGGSKTDLSCFNDEALVRKVASSNKPIISGIGHEIDTSLCDLAADIYAITPTEAANKALPDLTEVKDNLSQLANKLQHEGGKTI